MKSKFDSRGDWVRLILATIQSRDGKSVVKKSKNENIQEYNFACDFVWVRNLVSDTKGGT
jgi:hypothetical protein